MTLNQFDHLCHKTLEQIEGRPMESDDVAFARLWAGMQEPPMEVIPYADTKSFLLNGYPIDDGWCPSLKTRLFRSESAAWESLAKELAPIRRSLEPAILRMRGGK